MDGCLVKLSYVSVTMDECLVKLSYVSVTMDDERDHRVGGTEGVAGLTDVRSGIPGLQVQNHQIPVLVLISIVYVRLCVRKTKNKPSLSEFSRSQMA